ncbi:MAG: Smr/MutS family protein [Bacilli bacterium]|nr:Smr/MutS family protein [Bacilli bacterium]
MKKKPVDPFTVLLPHLDLHGETADSASFLLETFIKDNYLIQNKKIVVIHGRSGNVLKKKVQEILSKNKYVDSYNIDPVNDGQTIISIKNVTKS